MKDRGAKRTVACSQSPFQNKVEQQGPSGPLSFTISCAFLYNFPVTDTAANVIQEHLPFYITGPGESDILFTAVTITLILVLIGFGALYFTIQAIPDRLVEGTSKAQMQLVGILGLISLITMNNAYWIAAILLAAVRIPDIVSPLKEIARARTQRTETVPAESPPEIASEPAQAEQEQVEIKEEAEGEVEQ